MPRHIPIDVALLHQLWTDGVPVADIALRFGVSISTMCKWQSRYKLPNRRAGIIYRESEPPPPSDDDAAASLDSLALSPWVEQRAKECRERHYEQRRNETDESSRCKAWRLDRGEFTPQGGRA